MWDEREGPTQCIMRNSEQSLPGPQCFLGQNIPEEWQVWEMPLLPLSVKTSPDKLFFLLTHPTSTRPGLSKTLKMG